ncbi:hypothetical protein GGD65_004604 [Bradyrhizobium sp. CIR18]|uniref:hypothetical protein n=1 Tax=Bradyrhizobium sp. CIR18 TaxID=2663839 RepID=UPI001605DF55|nr:hypothetical protein [Bradyrhizobium sp. CIR18]MBB4363559.1 hypothetical protein [Bradyrhizobium sp. CIR18]
MRRTFLVVCALCIAVIGDGGAFASSAGTFASTLRRFGVDLVVPLERFDPTSSRALFPGAMIARVDVNTLSDKGKILRLSGATICPVPGIDYGSGQRTSTYRQSQSTRSPEPGSDIREAMLLFGFDQETLGSLKGYSLELSQPRMFSIPFDRLNEFSARSDADAACAATSGNRSVISRSLVATVDVTIVSHRPLSPRQLDSAARTLSPDRPVAFRKAAGDEFAYSAKLPDRWVGIATELVR